MALGNFGVDWLLSTVYRLESIATSSQTFNDEDVIEFLNIELQSVLTPIIQSVNEEFGVMYFDTPVSALTSSIRIPSQATGARLRNVQLINPNGLIQNLPRLNPDKLGEYGFSNQLGFYIQNNELVFYPSKPTLDGTLRLCYFRRPNSLVASAGTGRVLAVDPIGNTITLDTSPAGVDWIVGADIDVIIGESPFDFRLQNQEIISLGGPSIELTDVSAIQVGDYVALSGQSPVAQFIPAEATYLLAQLAAARCLQALGDTEGYKVSLTKIEQMKNHLINLISDRIEGQPKRIGAVGLARRANTLWY